MNNFLREQLKGLEAIIASKRLPHSEKINAMKAYERVLARERGITLEVLEDVKDLLKRKGLGWERMAAELHTLEDLYALAARRTHKDMKAGRFAEKEWRRAFKGYVNNLYTMQFQERMLRKKSLEQLRAQRAAERAAGKKPLPWRIRQKPK